MLATFLIFIILLGLNAFFSIAEFSIVSSRKLKLQNMIHEGSHFQKQNAKKILNMMEMSTQFITLIQISLNFIAILSGILGEQRFSGYLSEKFVLWGASTSWSEVCATFVTVLTITSFFILFTELIPKKMAFSNPEKVALIIITPLYFFLNLFKPLIWVLSTMAEKLLKWLNISTVRDEAVTWEDMSAMITQGAESGVLQEKEHHMIENVFSLTDRTVLSAMTPKDEIIYLNLNDTPEIIKDKFLQHPHSRFLVCDGELDNLMGFIESTNILKGLLNEGSLGFDREKLANQGLRNILTVPDTLSLLDTLDKFRETRQDMAAIVNEFGIIVGLITINDILSTLMGNVVAPILETELIVKRAENSWLIDGKANIEDVKKLFDWDELPAENNYQTISGFLMYQMKCIPKKAQTIEFKQVKFEIVDVEKYRIDEVMATIIEKENQ